jgi:hypothetical protein
MFDQGGARQAARGGWQADAQVAGAGPAISVSTRCGWLLASS